MIDLSGIDVEDLLIRLDMKNLKLSSSGMELNFSCFGGEHSHGDESPSAYINVETTAWFCHGCKRRGNAVTIVMEVQQVSRVLAERFLRETYGIQFNEPIGGSMVAETEAHFREPDPVPDPPKPSMTWVRNTHIHWDEISPEPFQQYMFDRGFRPHVLADWQIGYDYISDRLTIPVFDIEGEVVGVKARAWREGHQPKYLVLGDRPDFAPRYGFTPYEAANYVFGLHRNRDHKTVVLCEGELNAVALSQLGVPRPIANGMSYFTDRHAQLVIREADEVVVYYDHGEAGHQGTWGRRDARGQMMPGVVGQLEAHARIRVVQPTPDDPAELMRTGRGDLALSLIAQAPSALALTI